jgi:hypothetical protein
MLKPHGKAREDRHMPTLRRDNKKAVKFFNARTLFKIGGTTVTSTAAEINTLGGNAAAAEYTIGAEAANVINVAVQLQDANAADLAVAAALQFYLADDAAGLTPSTTAPDGGIAIGTDGALIESVANLSGLMVSEADGDVDIDLTHAAGAATWYIVVVLPNGALDVSAAITFA